MYSLRAKTRTSSSLPCVSGLAVSSWVAVVVRVGTCTDTGSETIPVVERNLKECIHFPNRYNYAYWYLHECGVVYTAMHMLATWYVYNNTVMFFCGSDRWYVPRSSP